MKTAFIVLGFLPLTAWPQSTTLPPPGGVLSQFAVNSFTGNGTTTINAMTTDAAGYVYLAGSTTATDLKLTNATQPAFGEGSVFRSLDRGSTWQKLVNPPGHPFSITPDPIDPQTLYVSGADGIYKTSDGGATWRSVYSFAYAPQPTILAIAVDAQNPQWVYALQSIAILTSGDGGASWSVHDLPDRYSSFPAGSLWVDPHGSGTVALGSWLSHDHGATWNPMVKPVGEVQSGVPDPWQVYLSVPDSRNAGWIYAATSLGASGQLFFSQNWGSAWVELATPHHSLLTSVLPDPDVMGTLYLIESGVLYVSQDGGASWRALTAGLNFYGPLVALSRGCNGGALLGGSQVSPDFGKTWQTIPVPQASSVASGPGCALYAARATTMDAFVARLAPGGEKVLWSTYLGGSQADSAAAIGLDGSGNIFVAGITSSPDFPATTPRTGVQGISNAFVSRFDPNGNLQTSTVIGGEARDMVTGMAVTPEGEAFLAGVTNSDSFPVTAGALTFEGGLEGDWRGFAVRISPMGAVVYSGNLRGMAPNGVTPIAVATESGGTALFGGQGGTINRMAPDGSSLTFVAQQPGVSQQPGPIYEMATGSNGDVYVASVDSKSPDVQSTFCSLGPITGGLNRGDLIVAKLHSASLLPLYSTRVAGQCLVTPSSIALASDGSVTVGAGTLGSFPTLNPALATGPASLLYQTGSGIVVQFDPSGTLRYSTFVAATQTPSVAMAPDGSVYAGTVDGAVLHLAVASSGGPMMITGAFNAFDGTPGSPTPGMLLTITGQNLVNSSIDLGLNDPNPLPTELGGVQVLFDGMPGEIMQIAPDHIICVVPWQLAQPDRVSVQVVNAATKSTPLILPGGYGYGGVPGILTQAFPGLPGAGSVDGNVRNSDGTLNSPDNPAAALSTVTIFATGLQTPGPFLMLWNAPSPQRFEMLGSYYFPGTARKIGAGFIDALWAIDFQIPANSLPGRNVIGRAATGAGVYVK